MMAERLTRKYVREMDFNKGNGDGRKGIAQGNTGVGKGGWIDQNKINVFFAGLMDTLYQG